MKLTGHSGCINAIQTFGDKNKSGFIISASQDKSIIIWNENGSIKHNLIGHTENVVEVSLSSDGKTLISSSWDRTAKVWDVNSGKLLFNFNNHGNIVSSAIILENGYFVTYCEDRMIRIFSPNGDLFSQSKEYSDILKNLTIFPNNPNILILSSMNGKIILWNLSENSPQKEISDYNGYPICYLTAKSNYLVTCSQDRVLRIFNILFDNLELKQSITQNSISWGCCFLSNGDIVTSGSDNYIRIFSQNPIKKSSSSIQEPSIPVKTHPKTIDGKEFDFVFDVDVQEGCEPLKIGFNRGDDPWAVSKQFVLKHKLEKEYLPQIVEFLTQNVGPHNIALPSSDPITGGSRYIPPTTTTTQQTIPSSSSSTPLRKDPLTGDGGYHGKTINSQNIASRFFPLQDYIVFDSGNLKEMKKKIFEFNKQVENSVDENILEQITEAICNPTEFTSFPPNYSQILLTLLRWPSDKMIPVLDLFRLIVRNNECQQLVIDNEEGNFIFSQILSYSTADKTTPQRMLSFRFLSNLFPNILSRQVIHKYLSAILTSIEGSHLINHVQSRIAYASLLQNLCIESANIRKSEFGLKIRLTQQICSFLLIEKENEIIFSLCVALGTLISSDLLVKEVVIRENFLKPLKNIIDNTDGNTKSCAFDLKKLLL
eukprot:c21662_g1_i1.p1 GENE.c21662_g1_i1~~c21662_g1_i1.p1  ORF type:complete len:726 (+),score=228.77 c21662_g1_i1:218-2179(+)